MYLIVEQHEHVKATGIRRTTRGMLPLWATATPVSASRKHSLPIEDIVHRYRNQWVLVEATVWDTHVYSTVGIMRGPVRHGMRVCSPWHVRSLVRTFHTLAACGAGSVKLL
jgi:hypothetical protein